MNEFELLDISGDAGVRAFGSTLEDLFIHAAQGMYSLITDMNAVREKEQLDISITNEAPDRLLVSWLNELIFRFDTYGFVAKMIIIRGMKIEAETPGISGACSLEATISGEEFDPERHERRLLLKAATYHMLRLEKKNGLWEAEVIFDI
ncbi:MAG: archease [Nitrospirae bacterium]|nr:archease [Nitrospirota bacterium]